MQPEQRYPCGQTRRETLWKMGCGFTGLALTDLLIRDDFFLTEAHAESPPIATKPGVNKPHHRPRAKACIFLTMNGAPSQVDTFDYNCGQ